MPEKYLRQPRFPYSASGPFAKKTNKEHKNLKKQEINDIFIRKNQTKLVFNNTWLRTCLNGLYFF